MGIRIRLDPDRIADLAREAVLRAADETGLDGRAKRRQAARDLARRIDDEVTPRGWFGKLWDSFDRPIYVAIISAAIEGAYRALKAEGHPRVVRGRGP